MAIVVKTVKPAGGGDYTTLAAWKTAAVADTSNFWWAECYGGGDLGVVTLSGFSGSLVADASNYVRIYAATGEQHSGTYDGAKANIQVGSGQSGIICTSHQTALDYIRIEGIQFKPTTSGGSNAAISLAGLSNVIVDGNLALSDSVNSWRSGTGAINIDSGTAISVSGNTVRNNAVMNGSNGNPCIRFSAGTGRAQTGALIYNNTTCAGSRGIALTATATSGASSATITNNIAIAATTACFGVIADTNSVWTKTGSYNLSSDATGDDWGATGALISQTSANVVNDVTADLRLKAGSPALDVGTSLSGSFTTDAIGTTRPQGSAWDMGAFETVVATASGLLLRRRRMAAA